MLFLLVIFDCFSTHLLIIVSHGSGSKVLQQLISGIRLSYTFDSFLRSPNPLIPLT